MKKWQSRDLDLSDPSLKPSPGACTLPGTKGQGPAVPGSVLSLPPGPGCWECCASGAQFPGTRGTHG